MVKTTPIIETADMESLRLLPLVQIKTSFDILRVDNKLKIVVNIKNKSNTIAFFLRKIIIDYITKKIIITILWNENCISLLSDENYEITGTIISNNNKNINSWKYCLLVDGWNTS